MEKSQLTDKQQQFLSFFSKTSFLYSNFYLTGGTCLSEYYLHHRYSEDLDFFSEREFDPMDITMLMKTHQSKIGYKEIDFQHCKFNSGINNSPSF